MDYAFGVLSKKSLQNPRSQRFSPMFSSGSFIGLGLIFRSRIHFDLNFCAWYKVQVLLNLVSYVIIFVYLLFLILMDFGQKTHYTWSCM